MKSKRDVSESTLMETNISLVVKSYGEMFSDFDARDYEKKSLSVDFLGECKRAARDKENKLELRLMIPREKRNTKYEMVIKNRLKEHFQRHRDLLEKERKKIFNQGLFFIAFGVLFMVVAAYILYYYATHSFVKELLVVLLEPGGWFLFWQVLDLIIFKSKEVSPDLEFYRKMSNSEIIFLDY
jgi:hypothetical protein